MGYELFTRKRMHGGPPAVSITKYGLFVFNGSAMETHILPNRYVHVYWDKDAGKVGIKPLPKKADKAYHINLSPRGNVGTVSAASFLKFIGYDLKETTSFPATWNKEEGLLEFTVDPKKQKRMRVRDED